MLIIEQRKAYGGPVREIMVLITFSINVHTQLSSGLDVLTNDWSLHLFNVMCML